MRNRVERLRVWLVGSAVLLLLVLAAFIGSARYLRRHYLAGLPARLGINIVRETNGYEYCPSVGAQKEYCIKAAKAVEHSNGKIAMHDVSITVYGKNGDRSDRIYGDEFEYDRVAQVVRATGVVHIDLQSAEVASQGASSTKVVHVTTSGLVYLQKLGIAATSDAIEFQAGGMTGHAVGADYSSDSGMMMLHSAVTMSGTMSGAGGGHGVAMTAATAQFDQRSNQAVLTHATYESEGRRAAADEATLDRRTDGTLARIRAKGDVRMDAKGAAVTSERADISLTAESQPQTAVLTGAVKYTSEQPLRQVHGLADEATIEFDEQRKPQAAHAVFTGATHMTESTRANAAAAWNVRELTAAKVETWLAPGDADPRVRDVEATGSSRLKVVDNAAGGSTTELAADDLKAHMIETGDAKQPARVDTIAGRGHTLLRQVKADGGEQMVAADSLDAKMRPSAAANGTKKTAAAGGAADDKLAAMLWSSVQQGHVAMMRRVPAKVGAKAGAGGTTRADAGPSVEHALADRAVYDGDLDRLTLSDGVQVSSAEGVVWASHVAFDQKTEDAHASGGVKVSYSGSVAGGSGARGIAELAGSSRSDGPTHVVADRADFLHASGIATFYGRPVRLWQGGNQVQAAVIELSNAEKRLVARGDGTERAANGAQVLTVLARSGGSASGAAGASAAGARGCESSAAAGKGGMGGSQAGGATRISSGGMTYSGAAGQADFSGGFRAETTQGTIRANQGIAYMRQRSAAAGEAEAPTAGDAAAVLTGDLDRVMATGEVELYRPGLKAIGKRLVYTASDGVAVLTGDEGHPPKAIEQQGTTTGAALRFRTSCDGRGGGSVEVVGSPGQRVQTDGTMSDRKSQTGR